MSSKSIVRITTEDTKKTYDFPDESNPQIWAVKLQVDRLSPDGSLSGFSSYQTSKIIHIERETLENARLVPIAEERKDEAAQETAEDLILRLLEHVGVYPVSWD